MHQRCRTVTTNHVFFKNKGIIYYIHSSFMQGKKEMTIELEIMTEKIGMRKNTQVCWVCE